MQSETGSTFESAVLIEDCEIRRLAVIFHVAVQHCAEDLRGRGREEVKGATDLGNFLGSVKNYRFL